jgi:hypothetical protein
MYVYIHHQCICVYIYVCTYKAHLAVTIINIMVYINLHICMQVCNVRTHTHTHTHTRTHTRLGPAATGFLLSSSVTFIMTDIPNLTQTVSSARL